MASSVKISFIKLSNYFKKKHAKDPIMVNYHMILTQWTILKNNELPSNVPMQGFPNNIKGCGEDWKFCLEGGRGWIVLPGSEYLRRSDFDNSNILKLKTAFYEYWTSIKIKISIKEYEYEIKTKMIQEQWLELKMTFLLG